jgi:TrmH family RNA methyltransferase
MITSPQNRKIKDMRQLRRSKGDELALLEGPHLVLEALACGVQFESVLATPEFLAGDQAAPLRAAAQVHAVAPALLAGIADADAPREVIAAARLPRGGVEALPLRRDAVYVYAAGLQDPGNLGALARVAEASGAAGLALAPGAVHANHPRALRGSAGSLLRLPVASRVAPEELAAHLAPLAPRWVALVPRGGAPLWEAPLDGALVLLLGAEGPGLPAALAHGAELRLTIPLAPPVESLNATVAAAVVLFELRRRRARRESVASPSPA